MKLVQNRGAGDLGLFALCGHPEAGLTVKEVNALYDLARMLGLGSAATHFLIQRFEAVVPVGSTTDFTFTDTIHSMQVMGGYVSVRNAEGDYDMDVGIVDAVTSLCNDVITKLVSSVDDYNGVAPIVVDYLTAAKDVVLTITTNAALTNTKPILVEIFLLCHVPTAA